MFRVINNAAPEYLNILHKIKALIIYDQIKILLFPSHELQLLNHVLVIMVLCVGIIYQITSKLVEVFNVLKFIKTAFTKFNQGISI